VINASNLASPINTSPLGGTWSGPSLTSHVLQGLQDDQHVEHLIEASRWASFDVLEAPDTPIMVAAVMLLLAALFVWQGPSFNIL
jgi:hypothetical protein